MIIHLVRLILRPIERISAKAAAVCWVIVLTFAWLRQHRKRARAWKTLTKGNPE